MYVIDLALAEIDVKYEHGFATLSVPLPSRRERCQFTLLPATQTLNDLVSFLEQEDKGTDYVAVYSLGTLHSYGGLCLVCNCILLFIFSSVQ